MENSTYEAASMLVLYVCKVYVCKVLKHQAKKMIQSVVGGWPLTEAMEETAESSTLFLYPEARQHQTALVAPEARLQLPRVATALLQRLLEVESQLPREVEAP